MIKEMYQEYEHKMKKTVEVVISDFGGVRAGRANASVLDKISVEYYGTETPINQVASISAPDPRTLVIQPWDGTLLKAIEKALLISELGINPQNDGKVIRLVFPQLTEERRKELTKQVKKYGEGGKVAIRNIRRDAMEKFKAMKKKSEITEDDLKECEETMQKMTDKRCKEIDELTDSQPGTGEGLDLSRLPRHVGIIMDGNGRWAKKRGLPRTAGHAAGAESFRTIAYYCKDLGIPYLTVYAFSTENWKRPMEEVSAIMDLLQNYLLEALEKMERDGFRVHFFGDLEGLPPKLRDLCLRTLEEGDAQDGTRFQVNVCLNYGGRDEILRAAKAWAADVQAGRQTPEALTDELFSRYLDSRGVPDPDLIIRPSGELRLSNFLPWQSAYAEFYFTDVLWPDFGPAVLDQALIDYQRRQRRFGGV